MTHRLDPRLEGREPEFARMSLRPGLGVDSLHEVASTFMKFNLDQTEADVPSALRHGSRLLPLGRFLKRKLRTMVGKDEKAPQAVLDQIQAEVLPLWDAAIASTYKGGEIRNTIFKNALIDQDAQKVLNQSAKTKIFKQRKSL